MQATSAVNEKHEAEQADTSFYPMTVKIPQ
jgi:hypothetical protein